MPHATGMSDTHHPAGDPATPGHPPYDRPPRQALSEMPAEVRAVWRDRYITGAEAELRVLALLDQAEATLRPGGAPATIRTLWIALADRGGTVGQRRPARRRRAGRHSDGVAPVLKRSSRTTSSQPTPCYQAVTTSISSTSAHHAQSRMPLLRARVAAPFSAAKFGEMACSN